MNALKRVPFVLLATLLLSGCGGGGTTGAKMEVVNGFAVSASGYDGGLIIYGKKDSGETFSISLTNSTTTTLELTNGAWEFWAVGWEGDTDTTLKFSGQPRCGYGKETLNGTDKTILLAPSTAKCNDDQFASLAYRDAGVIRDFKYFVTTKSLLKYPVALTDLPSAKMIQAGDSVSSLGPSFPADLKSNIKSVKMFALNQPLAGAFTRSFSSHCIPTGAFLGVAEPAASGKPYFGKVFKLPTKNIPLSVVLYEKDDCTEEIAAYEFKAGLERSSNGDHLLQVDASTNRNRLVLPSNDTLKGYSSFMHLLPSLKCGTGAGMPCKTMPSALPDFVLFISGSEKIYLKDITCPVTPTNITVIACTPSSDGGADIEFDTSALSSSSTSSITDGNVTYNIGFQDSSVIADRVKKSAYDDMLSLIGPNQPFLAKLFLHNNDDDEDENRREAFGKLGRVREHLSPAGAMGILGLSDFNQSFQANCHAISGTREVTLKDDEGSETLRIVASSATLSPDTYTCVANNSDATPASCTTASFAFDKKIQVYNLTTNQLVMTYTVDCDNLIGKFSSFEEDLEDDGSAKNRSHEIVSWNTDPVSNHLYQRFEFLSQDIEWEYNSGTFVEVRNDRQMGRVFKTGQDKYQIVNFQYHTNYDIAGANRNSSLEQRQTYVLHTIPVACITNRSQASSNITEDLFSGTYSTFRSTAIATSGVSADKLPLSSNYDSATVTARVAADDCDTNPFAALIPAGNNNDKINKSLDQKVDALSSSLPAVFSSGTYMNH